MSNKKNTQKRTKKIWSHQWKERNHKHWMAPGLRIAKIGLLSNKSERSIRQSFSHDQSVLFLQITSYSVAESKSLQARKTCSIFLTSTGYWSPRNLQCSGNPLICPVLYSHPPHPLKLGSPSGPVHLLDDDGWLTEIKARVRYTEESQIRTKGQGWSPFPPALY